MTEARTPWRLLVVDDEPLARASLVGLLADDPEVALAGECRNGKEALEFLRQHDVDLLLLDVQMPGMTGFELLEALGEERRPHVVFVTAYDHFALRAFDVHALDYLLKPYDDDRFRKALARAKDELARDAAAAAAGLDDLLDELAEDPSGAGPAEEGAPSAEAEGPLERLAIHREGRVEVVWTRDLRWVQAADQYVRLHTRDGEHLMRESMSRLARRLDPKAFVRVHRSAIVAIDAIRRLESLPGGSGRLDADGRAWLPVSRSRMPALRKML